MISPAVQPGSDPAERARTVLSLAVTPVIEVVADLRVVLDALAVDTDGSLVLLVDEDGPLAERVAGQVIPGTVRSALVSGVPGPDRRLRHRTARLSTLEGGTAASARHTASLSH